MTQVGENVEMIQSSTTSLDRSNDREHALIKLRRVMFGIPSSWVMSVILFSVALGLNLYRLGDPSIWFDEAFSVELARQPLPLLWHIIFGSEPNMELYYLFLHFWLGLTGRLGFNPTESVVRFPSAIFAALSVVALFWLGRRFLGTIAGLVGASLYLLNNLQLTYAQQTRSYSMQLLLICVAWYALLLALSSPSSVRRWRIWAWVCYILAMVLAIYAHLFSLFLLLAQLVAVAGILLLPNLWRQQVRQQMLAFALSVLTISILIVPMLLESLQGAKTGWLPIPHFSDLVYLFVTIAGNNKLYLLALIGCIVLGVVVLLISSRLLSRSRLLHAPVEAVVSSREQRDFFVPIAWSLLCWLIVPLVVSYVISQGSTRLFSTRYLVVIVPALLLLVSLGVAVLRWRTVRMVLALGLIVLASSALPLYYRSAQVEDWNSTTHWLQRQYQAGDGLVCYDNTLEQGCQVSVEYYLHAYPSGASFSDDSPGAFSWKNFGPANPASGPDQAVDPTVLAAFGAKHPRIFFIVGRVRDDAAAARAHDAQQWLDRHYSFVDQVVTRTVTIRLYTTALSASR